MIRTFCVIAAALALAGCDFEDFGPGDRFKTDFHYSYDLNPGGRIDVESFNGAIEIDGQDQNKVEISGTKYGATEQLRDAVRIDVSPSPDAIVIRAERPSGLPGSMGARFTIHVPRSAVAGRVSTSNAAIRVSDVAGDSRLRTSNGAIRIQNVKGGAEAQTSNGSIDALAITGDAVLRSSNGRITAEQIGGSLEANTSNSSIKVRFQQPPGTLTKLETSNGSIEVTFEQAPKADMRATTSNSSINVHLPEGASARISASTSNGSISSDFDVATHGEISKTRLEGSIGNGGPMLTLRSSNGSIRILKGVGQ